MKSRFFLFATLIILFCTPCLAQTTPVGHIVKDSTSKEQQLIQSLLGNWEIDLRPSPDAAPYLKDFTIKAYESETLKGVFYDTDFDNGRIHTAWGKLYFAFTTADGSGVYYHSGYVEKGKLYGTSFSPGRGFVMPWTGVRKE